MGANASRNETGKARSSRSSHNNSKQLLARSTSRVAVDGERRRTLEEVQKYQKNHKDSSSSAGESAAGGGSEQPQHFNQEQQRSRQQSTWSLSSLSSLSGGRLNWSFTGAVRSSFRNRNKNITRKSFSATQQRRSKTLWHRPLTNAIFSSHFKQTSRNEHFHIERLIAKGAFGVVFKVINKQELQNRLEKRQGQLDPVNDERPEQLTAVYALKVLKKSKLIEQNSVQQIKDEADIQRLCGHHPFIVQQIDLWQNRYNLHILSEYVPNGELFSKITTFSLELIRLYIAEIALAIDFLHNAGIIYRDAKPENILLTETYHIKLTDFGLSKWLKQGATTSTMCGTFQYMAPEILRGEKYGHAVDWWSLGIIACQMFTDRYPDVKRFLDATFSLETSAAAAHSARNLDVTDEPLLQCKADTPLLPVRCSKLLVAANFLPAAVESLPHAAKDVIQRLLHFDPKQRLRSVLSLQRIALYQKYKIDSKHLLSISPLDIMARDNIKPSSRNLQCIEAAVNEFDCF